MYTCLYGNSCKCGSYVTFRKETKNNTKGRDRTDAGKRTHESSKNINAPYFSSLNCHRGVCGREMHKNVIDSEGVKP